VSAVLRIEISRSGRSMEGHDKCRLQACKAWVLAVGLNQESIFIRGYRNTYGVDTDHAVVAGVQQRL